MNGKAVIVGSFVGAVGIITFSAVTNPDKDWPIPLPPPYRYLGAGISFGLLALLSEFVDEKLPGILAIGLLVGLGMVEAQTYYSQTKGMGNTVGGIAGGLAGKLVKPKEGGS